MVGAKTGLLSSSPCWSLAHPHGIPKQHTMFERFSIEAPQRAEGTLELLPHTLLLHLLT